VPLGSTSKAVLTDQAGHYRGIVPTAAAFRPDLDPGTNVSDIVTLEETTLSPEGGLDAILRLFDRESVDELAVVDAQGQVMGIVTEKYARRRYFEQLELSQRELFGEA
jgi:CIC family chloride channel protein